MMRWNKKEREELIELSRDAIEMLIEEAIKKAPKDSEGLAVRALINWGNRHIGGKISDLGPEFWPVAFTVEYPKSANERRRRIKEEMDKHRAFLKAKEEGKS